jgi:mono/diheme cytochrome c family protein
MPASAVKTLRPLVAICSVVAVLVGNAQAAEPNAAGLALFESQVHPVLAGVCFRCHGDQQSGGELRVDSREALLTGGDSGPAIVPGKADLSLLVRAIRRADDVSAMPPDAPLKPEQIAGLVAWINAGAPWPEKPPKFDAAKHWSYQSVAAHGPPSVKNIAWCRNEVDRFILAKMEAAAQKPAPEADRRTLIRRLTYDLTGLPPTPAEVAAFEQDAADGAYERVVDRLLKSPHYGEQWGRHWLDVVRYADTAGENTDHPLPHAWRYRNWVISALNADMPYDQFLREQIAGDLIGATDAPERYSDHVVATGFLAIARRFGHDIDKDVHLTYEDTIDTLGKAVLGLTVCLRAPNSPFPVASRSSNRAICRPASRRRRSSVSLWPQRSELPRLTRRSKTSRRRLRRKPSN